MPKKPKPLQGPMHTPSRVTRGGWPQPGPGRRGEGGKPTAPTQPQLRRKWPRLVSLHPRGPALFSIKWPLIALKILLKIPHGPIIGNASWPCSVSQSCPRLSVPQLAKAPRPALSPSVSPRVPASGPCPPGVSPHLSLSLYACPQLCISGSFKVCLPFHTLLCFFLIEYLH